MPQKNSYEFIPPGIDSIRSDGKLYIRVIDAKDHPDVKKGRWFLERMARDRNDSTRLVERLSNGDDSANIVTTAFVVEPPIHSGENWRSVKEHGSVASGLTRYVGFGFASRGGEGRLDSIDAIVVDETIAIHGVIQVILARLILAKLSEDENTRVILSSDKKEQLGLAVKRFSWLDEQLEVQGFEPIRFE